MNQRLYPRILLALVCLAFGILTGCSSNSTSSTTHTIAITAVSADAQQSTVVGAAMPHPLGITVTDNGSPASGLTVTYSAPPSGVSCALSATTAKTDSNGQASVTCTANGVSGGYNATATVSGAATPATFNLTNNLTPSGTFVFTVSGMEAPNPYNRNTLNYYAIAGVFTTDSNGNIFSGEQDYNDGFGILSPQPSGDSIINGSLMALAGMPPGQYQLTLVTNFFAVGGQQTGVENFIVQFANPNHALILEFDGSATSSGSMDLQTATSVPAGSFAFAMAGVDDNYFPAGYGGVFSTSGGNISGTVDADDNGNVALGAAFSGVASGTDSVGRGQITGVSVPAAGGTATLALNYYVVSPEVIRIIDVDNDATPGTGNAMLGSAYGQGSAAGAFSSNSVAASVFGMEQVDSFGYLYATAGMWGTPVSGTTNITGFADLDGQSGTVTSGTIAGNFSVQNTGYGSLSGLSGLGGVTNVGMYLIDPALNLLDPNNSLGGGGALLLDLDTATYFGGIGVAIPQKDTRVGNFNGTYVFGGQDYNATGLTGLDFNFLGQGSVTAATGAFTGNGAVDDTFEYFAASNSGYTGVPFTGTVVADSANGGRFTMVPLDMNVTGTASPFTVAIYQANGGQLFWLNEDPATMFLGPMETSSFTGASPARSGVSKPAMKQVRHQAEVERLNPRPKTHSPAVR